ncbi:hypothetical protein QJS10_CPA02g00318 [Acorus calamus]|uniref:Uncharacterized protein n=1 Tax=Acorus calamus TaxID=4465 RepID=A0AAV9FBM5_ACOCL|nr:hypothetical protein QJS10_CPA02g00318 [Acorus calamus]
MAEPPPPDESSSPAQHSITARPRRGRAERVPERRAAPPKSRPRFVGWPRRPTRTSPDPEAFPATPPPGGSSAFSRLTRIPNQSVEGVVMHKYYSSVAITEDQEVLEWLRWYRFSIKEIVLHDKVAEGTGHLNTIENEFYAAIRMAYYGPFVESMDLLPDCFEAEERSSCETAEVLHLVSGPDLFGIVRLVDRVPELPNARFEQLSSSDCVGSVEHSQSPVFPSSKQQVKYQTDFVSDVYGNLELHISGRVVATATRTPPKRL